MSKRNIIIVSIISLTVLGALGIWLSNKYTGEGVKNIDSFSFFGTSGEESGGLTGGNGVNGRGAGETDGETGKPSLPELRKISSSPTAGVYVFSKTVQREDKSKFNAVFLRRVDKATGNVYETRLDNMEETRVTNTTIPKIYEALWGNNENSLLLRYLRDDGETIETFTSKVIEGADGKEGSLLGTFLPSDIKSVAVSPKKDKIFYLNVVSGEAQGTVMDTVLGKKGIVFRYLFTEWLPDWPADNIITLVTKPSGKTSGFMYSINSIGGNMTKILGDIRGLTALMSPNGKKVLYSESAGNSFALNLYDVGSAETTSQSARTLSDKCVWSADNDVFYCAVPLNPPQALYPDGWYQGLVSFSDVLVRIDAGVGSMTVLVDPKEFAGEEIDAVNLALSKDENYLFFINKKDGAPWALEMGI
ncbi:MAG: hypothetical protein AAB888_00820 [Patescibacteria group bacterium]